MQKVLRQFFPAQPHPDPRLQTHWYWFQVALWLLPFSALLTSVGVSLISLVLLYQRFPSIIQRRVNQALAIVAGLMVLSAVLAYRPLDALLGLANFLPLFLVFAALSELIQTTAQVRRIAWLLVSASVFVVAIGLGEQFLGWSGEIKLLGAVIDWVIYPTGNPPGRMASVFRYANVLASYLAVTFSLSLGLWLHSWRFTPRRWRSPGQQIFLTIAVLANGVGLLLTDSRNAWAIALLTCLAFGLYLGWRWLLALVALVTGTSLGAAFAPAPLGPGLRQIVPSFIWLRLSDQLYPNRPVADLRSTQWQFALSLVQQRPLMGWGLRNFSLLYQEKMQFFIGHPHNLYLMLAAETGVPATLLFLGIIGWILAQGILLLGSWLPPGAEGQRAQEISSETTLAISQDALVLFTCLVGFLACTLFSFLDVTLFDIRVNLLGWLMLATIAGLLHHPRCLKA